MGELERVHHLEACTVVFAVVRIDLHRLDLEGRGRIDELRIACWESVEGFAKLSSIALGE
jgi:hypothetical protein